MRGDMSVDTNHYEFLLQQRIQCLLAVSQVLPFLHVTHKFQTGNRRFLCALLRQDQLAYFWSDQMYCQHQDLMLKS